MSAGITCYKCGSGALIWKVSGTTGNNYYSCTQCKAYGYENGPPKSSNTTPKPYTKPAQSRPYNNNPNTPYKPPAYNNKWATKHNVIQRGLPQQQQPPEDMYESPEEGEVTEQPIPDPPQQHSKDQEVEVYKEFALAVMRDKIQKISSRVDQLETSITQSLQENKEIAKTTLGMIESLLPKKN